MLFSIVPFVYKQSRALYLRRYHSTSHCELDSQDGQLRDRRALNRVDLRVSGFNFNRDTLTIRLILLAANRLAKIEIAGLWNPAAFRKDQYIGNKSSPVFPLRPLSSPSLSLFPSLSFPYPFLPHSRSFSVLLSSQGGGGACVHRHAFSSYTYAHARVA